MPYDPTDPYRQYGGDEDVTPAAGAGVGEPDDLNDAADETLEFTPVGGAGLSGGRPQQAWRGWTLRPDMGDADPGGDPRADPNAAQSGATPTGRATRAFRGQQPGEQILFILRQSWLLPAMAVAPIALGFVGLFALHIAFVGVGGSQAGPFIEVIILALLGILLVRWVFRNLLGWLSRVYILTDQRIVVAAGYLRRSRQEADLTNIQTVRARRPNLIAALLDIGNIEVATAGTEGQFYLTGIYHPEAATRAILNAQQTTRTGGNVRQTQQRQAQQSGQISDDELRPAVRAALDTLALRDTAMDGAQAADNLRANRAANLRFGLFRTQTPITLLPGERVVERIYRHWFVLLEREALPLGVGAAIAALGLLVGAIGGPAASPISLALILGGIGVALLWGALLYSNYVDDIFILTTHRIIDIDRLYFIFAEGRREALYGKIQDVRVSVSFLGRILGYGTINVETAGRAPNIEMMNIGHPLPTQDRIFGLINTNKERETQATAARQRQEYRRAVAGMLNELLVEAPDVRHLPLLDAASRLRAAGLKLVVEAEQPTEAYPSGVVLDQSPRPGASMLHGAEVQITLSRHTVPAQPFA